MAEKKNLILWIGLILLGLVFLYLALIYGEGGDLKVVFKDEPDIEEAKVIVREVSKNLSVGRCLEDSCYVGHVGTGLIEKIRADYYIKELKKHSKVEDAFISPPILVQ